MLKTSSLTLEQINYIKENVNTMRQDHIARNIGITKNQLKHLLDFHNIRRKSRIDKWATEENLEYIKANCNTLELNEICKKINIHKWDLYALMNKYRVCYLGEQKPSRVPQDGFFHHDPDLATI